MNMAFWNKELETMPREELEKMQLELIKAKVREMYSLSEFFRKKMESVSLTPDDINSFEDFRKIPFMRKTDLRDNYPDKLFVRPYDDLVRVHVSSGTTGKLRRTCSRISMATGFSPAVSASTTAQRRSGLPFCLQARGTRAGRFN